MLFALGIRFVGETVAKKLADAFPTIDLLTEASLERLVEVDEIGEKIAQSVLQFFSVSTNMQLIENLRKHGLKFSQETSTEQLSDRLVNLSFVVSGVFRQFSREQIKLLIEQNGGKNVSAISAKTNYVLAGDNMGPSKLEKAVQLGIPILSEDEFLKMLEA